MPGVGTGFLLIDYIIRPLWKFGMKFPLLGLLFLFLLYGPIAYFALKSAYLSDQY
jgi:hypothetical protein